MSHPNSPDSTELADAGMAQAACSPLDGPALDEALSAAGLALWTWEVTSDVIRCSTLGATLMEAPGRPLGDLLGGLLALTGHPDRESLLATLRQTAATGEPFCFERRLQAVGGSPRWILGEARLLSGAGGQAARAVGTLRAVHGERPARAGQRADARLRELDEIARAVVNGSQDWVWSMDKRGVHRFHNAGLQRVLGYSVDEFAAQGFFELIHEDDRPWVEEAFPRCVAERVGWRNLLIRWHHRDGSTRYLESTSEPMLDEAGELIGFRGIDRDVSDRVRFEEEKERLESQLLQAQKMEAVGRLAGGVAHDFNNLLTVILGNIDSTIELVHDRYDSEHDLLEPLSEIESSAQRAGKLTGQLLAFSRRQVSQPQVIDLNKTLSEMRELLRRLLTEDVQFVFEARSPSLTVRVDPGQFEQVMMNLVVNARDAMPQGGTLRVISEFIDIADEGDTPPPMFEEGRYVRVLVIDDGAGMDAETLERIFEPFFTTKELGAGTGLGLSTVYGIMVQSGGHVSVDSEPGVGSCFKLYFPAALGASTPLPESARQKVILGGAETILVCEDEPVVRRLIVRTLDRAGYRVLEAANGREAIARFEALGETVDLLVTDVIMPAMNGKDLSKALAERQPSLRALFCSGYTADVISHHGVLEEGVDFLAKPFTREVLLQRVRAALDPMEPAKPSKG